MFSDAQRSDILKTALFCIEHKSAAGASAEELLATAKAVVAAANAIEGDVGASGSIIERATRRDQAEQTPEAA